MWLLKKSSVAEFQWFDQAEFLDLLAKFSLNIIMVFIIIRFIYFPSTKKQGFVFSFFLINILSFSMCGLLSGVDLDTGFALGLFAIFGIIRYRTIALPIKEMTYLFLVIGVAVVNSLWDNSVSFAEILFINTIILVSTWLLEKSLMKRNEVSKTIIYEKMELIKPENRPLLLEDLKNRTGLDVYRVDILQIDYLRDVSEMTIYYTEE